MKLYIEEIKTCTNCPHFLPRGVWNNMGIALYNLCMASQGRYPTNTIQNPHSIPDFCPLPEAGSGYIEEEKSNIASKTQE